MEKSSAVFPPQSALNDLCRTLPLYQSLRVFCQGLAEGRGGKKGLGMGYAGMGMGTRASLRWQYQFEVRLRLCYGTLPHPPPVQRQLAQLLL